MQKAKLKFKIKNFLALGLIGFLLFIAAPAFSAEFIISSNHQEINIDEQFEVDFILNTEEENINAIEGVISFPIEFLELKEIRYGDSIINFWIEQPNIVLKNQIVFSGITPGGYIGRKGLVFKIIFQSIKEGSGVITIHDSKALLNDGKGTKAKVNISDLKFSISQKSSFKPSPVLKIKDATPPELFEPIIARDDNIFNGQYFLVFATQDKGSGIDHYEIKEGGRKFVIAKSPYLLQNQNLSEKIILKAIDKNNNERVVTLSPQKHKPPYKNYLLFPILIMGITFGYFIWIFIWKIFIRQKK